MTSSSGYSDAASGSDSAGSSQCDDSVLLNQLRAQKEASSQVNHELNATNYLVDDCRSRHSHSRMLSSLPN